MRPRTLTVLCPVGAIGSAALLGFRAVHALRDDAYDGRPFDRIGVALFLIALALAGSWLLLALGRSRFEVGPDAVVIRNPFRTYTVPIADVQDLTATRGGDWAKLRLTSGKEIIVMALSVGARWTLSRRLAELNEQLGWAPR